MNRFTNTHQMGIIGLCRQVTLTLTLVFQVGMFKMKLALQLAHGLHMMMACVRYQEDELKVKVRFLLDVSDIS